MNREQIEDKIAAMTVHWKMNPDDLAGFILEHTGSPVPVKEHFISEEPEYADDQLAHLTDEQVQKVFDEMTRQTTGGFGPILHMKGTSETEKARDGISKFIEVCAGTWDVNFDNDIPKYLRNLAKLVRNGEY